MAFGGAVTEGNASLSSHDGAPTTLQRILNLRVPLQNGAPADWRGYELSLEYMRHKGIIDQWARQHKGLDPTTLPNGGGFAREHVRRSSDNGTQSRRVAAVRR